MRRNSPPSRTEAQRILTYVSDRHVLCARCGYNLRNLTKPRCPECGVHIRWRDIRPAGLLRHFVTYDRTLWVLGAIPCWVMFAQVPLVHSMAWSMPHSLGLKIAADVIAVTGVGATTGIFVAWWLERDVINALPPAERVDRCVNWTLASIALAGVTLALGMGAPLMLSS